MRHACLTVVVVGVVGVVAIVASGCNGEIIGALGPSDGFGTVGTGAGDGGTKPPPGPGRGDGGLMTQACPDGQHLSGGGCVPDEITCAAEFPCPTGSSCVGGRCI